MLKPGYIKYCNIESKGNIYTFHNFRDFKRTREDSQQEQNRVEKKINIDDINSIDLYIAPFMFHKLIGHTIIRFGTSDGEKFCLSAESELQEGESYNIIKEVLIGYRIRYIWATERDIVNLRSLRKNKIAGYPIHIDTENMKKLFIDLVEETNKTEEKRKKYHLLFNNCTSSLRNIAKKHLAVKRRNYSLLLNAFLPKYLNSLGILDLQEKKIIQKID